jgi:hypothetical protein
MDLCFSMEKLPATGFTVYNMPHRLEGGSGGPTRVMAVLGRGATRVMDVLSSRGATNVAHLNIPTVTLSSILLMWIVKKVHH